MEGKGRKWTDEEKKYLAEIVPGHHYREIAELMIQKFKKSFTIDQIKNAIARYKLNTGFTGRFEKGHTAHNKGKKIEEYASKQGIENSKKTRFRKGNIPLNYRPVGSERVNVDGYIEIKIADPNRWRLKHIVVWEKENGPIPPQHAILFLDGNKQNVFIENLMLVTREELLILNRMKLLKKNADINKTSVKVATLVAKINEVRRKE